MSAHMGVLWVLREPPKLPGFTPHLILTMAAAEHLLLPPPCLGAARRGCRLHPPSLCLVLVPADPQPGTLGVCKCCSLCLARLCHLLKLTPARAHSHHPTQSSLSSSHLLVPWTLLPSGRAGTPRFMCCLRDELFQGLADRSPSAPKSALPAPFCLRGNWGTGRLRGVSEAPSLGRAAGV